jgi:hypothetical protein
MIGWVGLVDDREQAFVGADDSFRRLDGRALVSMCEEEI